MKPGYLTVMRWTGLVFGLCNVVSMCFAISFESTVIATNNLSSITALPSSASQSCGGCSIAEDRFQFDWYTEVFTHIAATVVKFVNNSTNVTRTSTIRASDFVLPTEARYAAFPVSGVVITTDIGGVDYTLTYPTAYDGVGGIASYTWFVATDSDGNVNCVSSTAYITREFLLRQYASIDELHSTIGIEGGCKRTLVSPPMVLVPVLSLTQTETNYERSPALKTSATRKAAPSKPIIAPTVTPTSSPEDIPRESPPTLPKPPSIDSRPTKPNTLPQTTLNVGPPSLPSPKFKSLDRAPASSKDLPPPSIADDSELQPSRINSENTGASKGTSSFSPATNPPESDIPRLPETTVKSIIFSDGGDEEPSKDSSTEPLNFGGQVEARPTPTPQPLLPVGSSVISANPDGTFVVGDQTLVPGGSPVTALKKGIHLQPSNVAAVIDDSTVALQQAPPKPSYSTPPVILPIGASRIPANPEGNFVIGSQTLVPGGVPVTAFGKSIYLQPSGLAAVIDGNTVALAQGPQILTFGTHTLEKEKAGGYIIGSQTLIPGHAPITVADTPFSLAPSASILIVDSTTIMPKAAPGVLMFGAQVLVPDSTGGYILGSHTLFPGRAPITIGGTGLSLAPSASALIIGSKTLTQRPAPALPAVVIHQAIVQANTASEYLIAGQTLVPGAPPISISGQPVSLAPGESEVVIGSRTRTLTSEKSGLASLILIGFGNIGSDATPTQSNATSSTLAAQYTGGASQGKWRTGITWIGLSMILMGLGIVI